MRISKGLRNLQQISKFCSEGKDIMVQSIRGLKLYLNELKNKTTRT